MAPVTFHGGPLHGITVERDDLVPLVDTGVYRLDGLSYVHEPAVAEPVAEVVHVRPAVVDMAAVETAANELAEELRPKRRQVTRR